MVQVKVESIFTDFPLNLALQSDDLLHFNQPAPLELTKWFWVWVDSFDFQIGFERSFKIQFINSYV